MNFSFVYDNKQQFSNNLKFEETQLNKDSFVIKKQRRYTYLNLLITQDLEYYHNGGTYSRITYTNLSDKNSKMIHSVYDIHTCFTFEAPSLELGFCGDDNPDYLTLIKTVGANGDEKDFSQEYEALRDFSERNISCSNGRSSQGKAPFIELNLKQNGVIVAVGWTGQWNAKITKYPGETKIQAGIQNLNTYLMPNESIQTASILVLPYATGSIAAHNEFRKIIKYNTPPSVKNSELPFFTSFWGGSTSGFINKQLDVMKDFKEPFECIWIDAGWYGNYATLCPSEFNDAWGNQTGNWFVNERVHPNKLEDVYKKSKDMGLKNLLWFEIERAHKHTELPTLHPDWFIDITGQDVSLLNLGLIQVQDYFVNLISEYITKYNLDFYRQDFNMDPLDFWQVNDKPDRIGITEIKYINGLYSVWDRLRRKFPHLIIDNCASGGRRLDIETLRRSIPLWRSDCQCCFDRSANIAQNHNTGISKFVPYSCTGIGFGIDDKYKFRSNYSSAMNSNFLGYENWAQSSINDVIAGYMAEFKSVRRYFSCDYYPILGDPKDSYSFCGWQYHDSELDEGIILVFRRENCSSDSCTVNLGGISINSTYELNDLDNDETFILSGTDLCGGLNVSIKIKRDSKLIMYKKTQ